MKIPRRRKAPKLRESTEDALQRFSKSAPQSYQELLAPAIEAGHLIRQARAAARLTQTELAEATGLPQSAISDLERGVGVDGPTYRTLNSIGKVLGQRLTFISETIPKTREIMHPRVAAAFKSGSPPEENGMSSSSFEGRKFLLASEDSVMTSMVTGLLDSLGSEVVCHKSGDEAIGSVNNHAFDAILIDAALSHPDYKKTCQAMREIGVTIPIILLTATEKIAPSKTDVLNSGASDSLLGDSQFTSLPMRLGELLTS